MAADSWPNRIGRYEVLGRLGSGGMAEVLLCRLSGASGFERLVALKRVLPTLAQQPGFVSMFLDEARIVASIRHPNVVQVSELIQETGELCIVMEYLDGESLSGLRQAQRRAQQPLSASLACFLIAEAANGLHAAHELTGPDGASLGVVHRDLSPGNLFVTYGGVVKLLDFGVAHARGRLTRTESGLIKGKLEYMSPEQARGLEVDRRSDVFSLGVVLWETLTGRALFRRPSVLAVAQAIDQEPIAAPSRAAPEVPPELDAICLKALARPLEERYQTAAELRRDLLKHARLDEDPAQALAALMRRCFSDRIAEKDEMVRKARTGASDVLVRAEELAIEDDAAMPAPKAERPRRRAVVSAAAAFAAVLFAGGVAIGFGVIGDTRPPQVALIDAGAAIAELPAEPPPPPPPPTEPAPPPAPADEWVNLRIETAPAGAQVEVGGEAVGVSPVQLRLKRSDAPVKVIARKRGFKGAANAVSPRSDQTLVLTLVAAPAKKGGRKEPDPLQQKW